MELDKLGRMVKTRNIYICIQTEFNMFILLNKKEVIPRWK